LNGFGNRMVDGCTGTTISRRTIWKERTSGFERGLGDKDEGIYRQAEQIAEIEVQIPVVN
jgi:hypothetical protein